MAFLKIIALCIGSAVCYGIVHDQITARLCIEYFTAAHPIALLLLFMAIGAFCSGCAGYFLAQSGKVAMDAGFADAIPSNHHVRFVAAAWAHNASYLLGFAGGVVLIFRVWLARCSPALRDGLR